MLKWQLASQENFFNDGLPEEVDCENHSVLDFSRQTRKGNGVRERGYW